ncbi:hypothetical protein D023_0851B, partial [Vibrio parahaemolyticus 3256]
MFEHIHGVVVYRAALQL